MYIFPRDLWSRWQIAVECTDHYKSTVTQLSHAKICSRVFNRRPDYLVSLILSLMIVVFKFRAYHAYRVPGLNFNSKEMELKYCEEMTELVDG